MRIDRTPPGYNLREFREWWRFSHKKLSKRAGISLSLISRIENNCADPRLSDLRKLAEALRVNVLMLLDPLTKLVERLDKSKRGQFWKKVEKENHGGCWIWIGAKDYKTRYGKFGVGGKNMAPYRVAYAMRAPLPVHWEIDHKQCSEPRCVKFSHLEAIPGGRNRYRRDRRREQKKLESLAQNT